jgi:hypothetical protein
MHDVAGHETFKPRETAMKKIFITALLLASTGTAQAATEPCNPASGNWENAAPTTCRFMSPSNPERVEPKYNPIKEIPRDIPQEDVPA